MVSSNSDYVASITVVTNSPPLPGTFRVSPTSGVELSTVFSFVVAQWVDSDIPLMYQFGYVTLQSGANTFHSVNLILDHQYEIICISLSRKNSFKIIVNEIFVSNRYLFIL